MSEVPSGDDDILRSAKIAGVIGAAFAASALVLSGGRAATSVAIGAAIGVANLVAMRAILRALLPPPPGEEAENDAKGPDLRMLWAFLAGFKMLLMFGGMWLLLTKGVVDPIPLVVGYGAMPLGIVGSALLPGQGEPPA